MLRGAATGRSSRSIASPRTRSILRHPLASLTPLAPSVTLTPPPKRPRCRQSDLAGAMPNFTPSGGPSGEKEGGRFHQRDGPVRDGGAQVEPEPQGADEPVRYLDRLSLREPAQTDRSNGCPQTTPCRLSAPLIALDKFAPKSIQRRSRECLSLTDAANTGTVNAPTVYARRSRLKSMGVPHSGQMPEILPVRL